METDTEKIGGTAEMRVLVVDDQKVVARVYSGMLKSFGVGTVDIAISGEEAVQKVDNCHYDLVLSDVQMPGIGGIGFVRHVREERGDHDLPIYAVTSNTASIDQYRDKGFNAVLMKPFTRQIMAVLLRRYFR